MVESADGKRSAIEVCIAGMRCQLIAERSPPVEDMGIDRLAAGCTEFQSKEGDPAPTPGRICHKGEAIQFFRFASASSFFVFNDKTGNFDEYWEGD